MTNDALRSPRAVLRMHRRLQGTLVPVVLCGSALLSVSTGLSEDRESSLPATVNLPASAQRQYPPATYPQLGSTISYRIVLSPHVGAAEIDRNIQTAQRRVKQASDPRPFLEQLGWLYVTKARTSHDQGL